MSVFTSSVAVLGFERFANELDRLSLITKPTGFPPMDILREGEDTYHIDLAVAGYKKSEIEIKQDRRQGLLFISGSRETPNKGNSEEDIKPLYRSIACRQFSRQFTIADGIEIQSATMQDGMLRVTLKRIIREEDKPRIIDIT
jgi:molecular chaperone IbpA